MNDEEIETYVAGFTKACEDFNDAYSRIIGYVPRAIGLVGTSEAKIEAIVGADNFRKYKEAQERIGKINAFETFNNTLN